MKYFHVNRQGEAVISSERNPVYVSYKSFGVIKILIKSIFAKTHLKSPTGKSRAGCKQTEQKGGRGTRRDQNACPAPFTFHPPKEQQRVRQLQPKPGGESKLIGEEAAQCTSKIKTGNSLVLILDLSCVWGNDLTLLYRSGYDACMHFIGPII